MLKIIKRDSGCIDCKFCTYFISCPTNGEYCLGCGICVKGCPTGSRKLVPCQIEKPAIKVTVDGVNYSVPSRVTVLKVLELLGKAEPKHTESFCHNGSCFNCAVLINGKPARSCCTEILENMEIITDQDEIENHPPSRLISNINSPMHKDALSIFTHGCNLACDFCHNWDITFSNVGKALTPEEVIFYIEPELKSKNVSRVGISGGEPTLNRRWLIEFIEGLYSKRKNLRVQLDTNATILTPDYIDELYEAGLTDISPDIKALEIDTFMKVTGIDNNELAGSYLRQNWQAIEYIADKYADKLYCVIGIPYHSEFMSLDELHAIGKKIYEMNSNLDINFIPYQPAFRARGAQDFTSADDIMELKSILTKAGLKKVWCQVGQSVPRAMDPEDIMMPMEFEDNTMC